MSQGGANVDSRAAGPGGATPLALAAREGKLSVVNVLLENHAAADLTCFVSAPDTSWNPSSDFSTFTGFEGILNPFNALFAGG